MLRALLVYYEPEPSGQTTHVLSLARSLREKGHEVTVVLPARLERSVAAFRRLAVEVVPLPFGKVMWSPQAIVAVIRLIRRRGVDVVHVHSQEAGLLGRVVARVAGARGIIYTPQTIDIRRARWHWLYVLLECALARVTDAIVSVNSPDRKRLIEWGIPSTKVVIVPNGIDLGAFSKPIDVDALRRSLGLDSHRPLVMQVGRLSAQKDPLAFVEGALRVTQARPDAQFALVGEGPLKEAVTSRVQALGLSEHVDVMGWQDQGFRLAAAADIVTLTSRWEGTPYSMLEAMAWARPVVATAVNGCSELILDGQSGFLVPPGDTASWARRVLDLLDDPEMAAAMGRWGRRRVEEAYSLRATVARTESLYRQVARSRGNGQLVKRQV
jgi:glycosyltransferase involved in cell wall biosynthesis